MKITHKARPPRQTRPVVLDPAYQAEVDRATERLVRRYTEAEQRLARAEQRLARAEQQRQQRQQLADLRREVEQRLAELAEIERLMTAAPGAGSVHRGVDSWIAVPR